MTIYNMTEGDKNVVRNLRFKHGEAIAQYPDEMVALAYRHFSSSEDYPNEELFVQHWLPYEE